jgi:hypothetical protein
MNLIEILINYRDAVAEYNRAHAELILQCVDPILHDHIRACVSDNGKFITVFGDYLLDIK